jgi:hypothetical protein
MIRLLTFMIVFPALVHGQSGYMPSVTEQENVYSGAIGEYIKAVFRRDGSKFDTLFFGKHEDFPDIKLPADVQNTKIILLTSEQADKKLGYRRSLVYINMIATISKEASSFMLVTFLVTKTNGQVSYRPQHNCYIEVKQKAGVKNNAPVSVRFEKY